MARPKREADLKAQALKRYDELLEQRDEIEREQKALQAYLKHVGGSVTRTREGRKETKGAVSKKRSATGTILSILAKNKEGTSIDQIMKVAGVGRQTVNGVLNRMKKSGKVKALKRGVYVNA